MALGMMLPGMIAGNIQELLGGYFPFFIYIMVCSIVPVLAVALLKIEKNHPPVSY
jgi:PAT family beta-lactamase induction signal transducer AmpG